MSNAPFYIYRPTKPIGAISASEDTLPWVYDQDPSSGFCARMLVVPADALEAADKRIAELEQVNCSRLDEAERKLAVAREAIYALKRHVPVDSALHEQAEEALAQIGGDDAAR